jgi:hypothetical protein
MQYPFTTEQFLNVFKSYNESIFPLQVIFYAIGLFCVYLLFREIKNNVKYIIGILSFFWIWIGLVYHFIFFSPINKAAYFFGILFVVQGLLFLYYGLQPGKLAFNFKKDSSHYLGLVFILYSLMVYPLLGSLFGHNYPYNPTFGLPCPTTIFTFGVLLFVSGKIPVPLTIIPLLWSVIGFGAALNFSINEDYGLLITGIIGFTMLIINNRKVHKLSA